MDWHTFWIVIHIIGTVLGAGSITTTDLYIYHALRSPGEFRLSERMLQPFRLLIVIGIVLLLVSGGGMFLGDSDQYIQSQKFQAKMMIVLILLINGVVLLRIVTPRLLAAIQPGSGLGNGELPRLLKLAIPITVVSTVSWYAALVLGAVGSQSWSVAQVIGIYLGVVIAGIVFGLFINQRLALGELTRAAQAD